MCRRDNWTCAACGCHTPPHLRGTTDDNAPETDHKVALAHGGEHSYANVHLLCRLCNTLKGTMGLAEYMASLRANDSCADVA